MAEGAPERAPAPTLPLGLLAAAGFLSSAGARVVDPLLHPIATDFGRMVPEMWIVIASFTLPYGLSQILLGPIGDRFGKLRVILGALFAYALFTGLCATAATLPMLTLLRACAGVASAGLIPVGMAYIGDSVPYAARQVTLSRFLSGVVLAQVVAGPVGGVFGQYIGWRGVFVGLGIVAVAVGAALAVRLRGFPDRRQPGRMFNPATYSALAGSRAVRIILLAALLDGALFVGCFPFVAPYLHEHYGLSYAQAGLVLACFGIGAIAYVRLAPRLVRVLGEEGMVLAGGLCMSGGLGIVAMTRSWQPILLVELLLGFGFFLLHGVLQVRATEMLPQARATAVASFSCLLFLGQSAGALLMGAAIARFDYPAAFLIDAGCILVLTLWLSGVLRRGG